MIHALSRYDASIHPRTRVRRPGDGMRTIAVLVLTTVLTMSTGCAKTDWIDRTLVTVDVTGIWDLVGFPAATSLELEQQGSAVKGFIRSGGVAASIAGPIVGTVAGDVFRFSKTRGDVVGELTVSGDEMTGTVSRANLGDQAGAGLPRPVSLRRVDPSSRAGSPPR